MMRTMEDGQALADVPASYRCGVVALVGRANVGKSSLLNALLDDKVSIVSAVPQTTRNMVRAVLSEPCGQLVFMDTPGVHKASYDLGRIMNKTARVAAEGADVAVLVLDASSRPEDEDEGWMRRLVKSESHRVFVLNKQDANTRYETELRQLWQQCCGDSNAPVFWLSTSAKTGEGLDALKTLLFDAVPCGPPLFPEEMLSDYPRKWSISDVIREKYFQVLRDEIPHDLAVRVRDIVEAPDQWTVYADIMVNRPSQKGIVIGDKGRLLRRVKRSATLDCEKMFGCKIILELWVKVEKNWTRNHWILKQLGYVR